MTTRTQIDAPVTAEERPDASATLKARDDFDKAVERLEANIDKAFERLEMKIAVGLERFTNQFIRRLIVTGVVVVVSMKALDILFEQLLFR